MSWNLYWKILNFFTSKRNSHGTFSIMDQLKENFVFSLLLWCRILLLRLFTLPQSRTYNTNARESDACRGSNNLDQNTRQIHKGGSTWMWGLHNVRAPAKGNTGQNTHTQSQDRNKNSWPQREWNPGRRVGRQGLYRPHHADGWCRIHNRKIIKL